MTLEENRPMHQKLAQIESTFLGVEDHGIFTAMLYVKYEGSSGQGVGGYTLDDKPVNGERPGTAQGMQFVINTIRVVGAGSWEKIPGKMIYVLTDVDQWSALPIGIRSLGFAGEQREFLFASLWP
jgi:hypothetical protein